MPEPFFEDMGRKAEWFRQIHGSDDHAELDRVRDVAVAHVDVMRAARVDRLDPGGGAIDDSFVLLGRGGRAKAEVTDLPGHARARGLSHQRDRGLRGRRRT